MSVNEIDNEKADDARLRELAKQALDQSVDEIDGATLSRLRQARYAAIQQQQRRQPLWMSRPALASAFSVSALALVVVLMTTHSGSEVTPLIANDDSVEQMDDLNLLANSEDLDLVQDMEFYEWLEQQDEAGDMG